MAEEQQALPTTGALARALARATLKGVWFNNRDVILDGYRFEDCRFDNCRLSAWSTDFQLIRCLIDASTVVNYGSDASRLIKLFHSRNEWFYTNDPVFAPTRHEDGTISIL